MKIFLNVLFGIIFTGLLSSQNPGLAIQSGLTAGYTKDSNITKDNQAHYGWMVGADGRLLDGSIYFILGAQYHETSIGSTSIKEIFDRKDTKVLMGRFGLGFNILTISENVAIRSKLLGSINFILDAPSSGINIPDYTKINDSYMGAVTGLGLTLGPLDIDLDFQYGFINAFYKRPKSTFDSWTLMAGFHF